MEDGINKELWQKWNIPVPLRPDDFEEHDASRGRLVNDANGWTHLFQGGIYRHKVRWAGISRPAPPSNILFRDTQRRYEHLKRQFIESETISNMSKMFREEILATKNLKVSRAICADIISLTGFPNGSVQHDIGLKQLIAFEAMVGLLRKAAIGNNTQRVLLIQYIVGERFKIEEVFLQGKDLNREDDEFLWMEDYDTTRYPGAENRATEETFFFEPCPFEPDPLSSVIVRVLYISSPAIYVGGKLTNDKWFQSWKQ
ncbi:MAG: hypothetical protein LQ342_005967 [Letrouitia transgressa]|nr:MAG: hypothetical protein LQ342_005967 [Letrouitia transgressa]